MKVGTDHRVNPSSCAACGHVLDAAMCVGGDAKPSPGDVTVCIKCGHLQAFADDLSLRNLTDEEMHEFAGDERLLAIQAARAKVGGRS